MSGPSSGSALRQWVMRLVGVLVLVTASAGVVVTPEAVAGMAAGSAWRVVTTPNPARQPNGTLLSVSCAAATSCIAVGSSYNRAGITVTLAQAWNGARWVRQTTPNPPGAAWSKLYAVSCTVPQACTATGYYVSQADRRRPLAERWNGAQWSIQTAPSPAGARAGGLFAVSCITQTACTAVGEYNNSQGTPLTLAERWNGAQWSIQATPNPAGAQVSGLFGVSCPAAGACTAAGSFVDSSGATMSLALAWNGSDWAIQTTANPAGAASALLVAVSCTSAQACTATGNYTDSSGAVTSLAERWNGTAWALQTVPTPAGAAGSKLTAVSCTGSQACTAAGSSSGNSGTASTLPLALVWNGAQWSVQATRSPAGSTGGGFSGLACGAMRCRAVGAYAPSLGQPGVPLAEGWNGARWSIQPAPRRNGAVFSEFAALSCPSSHACSAVGASVTAPSQISTLAESWNGARWRIQPMPDPTGTAISMLAALSCAIRQACVAVGSYTTTTGAMLAFAEVWNGATWQVHAIPTPAGAVTSMLAAVSCPQPRACTAVGSYAKRSGSAKLLAERWNGAAWQIQPIAAPTGTRAPRLTGVSCPTTQTCTAVGAATVSGAGQPLALGWNGATWTARTVPLPAGVTGGQLQAVSCTTARACTATGGDSSSTSPVLAERWNGTTWHVQPTPTPPGFTGPLGAPSLSAVSCVPGSGCTATGNYTRNNVPSFFIEAWNGAHWRLQTAASPPGTTSGALGGVSCSQAGCTAVGGYTGLTGVAVTLALTTTP